MQVAHPAPTANQLIAGMKADANARARAQRAEREAAEVMGRATRWAADHVDVMEWLEANEKNDFAQSLAEQLNRRGFLTDPQVQAVRRKLTAAATPAPAISVGRIEEAFNAARASGLKRLRLHLDTFKFKPAGENSANAGGIYVTEGETYLGKVLNGKFHRAGACKDDQEARIIAAAADPEAAAHAYGQRTGQCAICGLELTAEESIQRSIGPICARKWGF